MMPECNSEMDGKQRRRAGSVRIVNERAVLVPESIPNGLLAGLLKSTDGRNGRIWAIGRRWARVKGAGTERPLSANVKQGE
jgi:hypothetical protein